MNDARTCFNTFVQKKAVFSLQESKRYLSVLIVVLLSDQLKRRGSCNTTNEIFWKNGIDRGFKLSSFNAEHHIRNNDHFRLRLKKLSKQGYL
jgi:hypothetical protein